MKTENRYWQTFSSQYHKSKMNITGGGGEGATYIYNGLVSHPGEKSNTLCHVTNVFLGSLICIIPRPESHKAPA